MKHYQKPISWPMLAHSDIHVQVPRVDYEKHTDDTRGEPFESVRSRVQRAREKQELRLSEVPYASCNADMGPTEVRQFCRLDEIGLQVIGAAMRQLGLSARTYHRVLKLARTIADLADSKRIEPS